MAKTTKKNSDPLPSRNTLADFELAERRRAVKEAYQQLDRTAVKDAYQQRDREDAERWRMAPSHHATGDPWFDVLMNFINFNEAEPLNLYLEKLADEQPAVARELRDLALMVCYLSAVERTRSEKPGSGNRGGLWKRWLIPSYVAAWFADRWIADWKRDKGEQQIPDPKRDEFINRAVAMVNKWHFAKRRKATPERVRELLREARSERL
jgi:hypothetical protein